MRLKITYLIITLIVSISSAAGVEELTWQDCLREAARNHPDLIAVKEGIAQQTANKGIAASDGLPDVTADLNASTSDNASSGSSKSFDYGLSGSQLLFDGLKTLNNVRAASQNIQAAKEGFAFTSSDVRLRLRAAFVGLLKAQALLSLTEEIVRIRQGSLGLIDLRYESGTEHEGALLTARANLSQAQYEINQARRGLATSQRRLIREMGRERFSPVEVEGDFEVSDRALEKPDFEQVVRDHPALLEVIAKRNAAAFDVQARKGEFWPAVSLTGGIGRSSGSWPPEETESSAGLKVSLPLFEGGSRLAQLDRSKSVYRQREQEERSVRDGAVLELERRWNELQDAAENVQVEARFLEAAEERAKIAEQQYSIGLITFDNWTIIEDDLVRNKKAFLDAQAEALLSEANWIHAKGETLEYEN